MKLRYYQTESIQSIYDWFTAGKTAPLIVLPTGAGKSVVLGGFIGRALSEYPDTKILVVTHVKELVAQDAKAIRAMCPHASVGIYSAGLGKKELKQVTVAGIQSIYTTKAFYGRFDLIIVDEAHLIPHKSAGMYRRLIDSSMLANDDVKLIGLTATPYRLGSGLLHKGDGALFDGISYEANVGRLIDEGFLCRLKAASGDNVNLDGIKITAGEYNIAQLGERMAAMQLIQHHADTMITHCKDRHAWLVFCVTVEHTTAMTAALRLRGIEANYVTGDTPNDERDQRLADFKSGKLQALVNCNVLTTGFDHPAIDAIVMLRPTQSPGLYVQMCGRGLRMHESKTDCLILDFGGNVKRHGFIDAITPPGEKSSTPGIAPVKECPECNSYVAISARQCECGHEFEMNERASEKNMYTGAMLSVEAKPVWYEVDRVFYSNHLSKKNINTLRVDYFSGLVRFSEYVCLEHDGWAFSKAREWWYLRTETPYPRTVAFAMKEISDLKKPTRILVSNKSKFPEVISYEFDVETISA